MQEINTLTGAEVGHTLSGFGVNLLVRDMAKTLSFLQNVLDFKVLRSDKDYAIAESGGVWFQFHADHTYAENPLLSLLPESGFRGAGIELRLYEVDPETAEDKCRQAGYDVLQTTSDKPHGLRECYLLDPDGYCWVPSRRV